MGICANGSVDEIWLAACATYKFVASIVKENATNILFGSEQPYATVL